MEPDPWTLGVPSIVLCAPACSDALTWTRNVVPVSAVRVVYECRLLLASNWMTDCQMIGTEVVAKYNRVIRLQSEWEPGFFYLGRYYDMLLKSVEVSGVLRVAWVTSLL